MSDETIADAETIAAADTAEMTPEQLAETKRYGRQQLVCDLIDRAVDLTFLTIAAFLIAIPLNSWLQESVSVSSSWVRLALLFGIVTGLHVLASFPISFYSGHVLEHRYGLSRQSFGRWFSRYLKRNSLTLVFGLLLFEGLYAIIWYTQSWWWLVAAVAFFLVSVVMGQLAPVLIMPLFYKIKRLEDQTLAERFRSISDGTGLSIEGVYRMEMSAETAKANAMLAGLGATRRVILGDTLLDEFSPDEIEVIFAHEVGHHVHRHIRKMIVAGIAYSLAGFYLCDWLVAGWVTRREGELDYANFPVWTLPSLMLTIAVFSLFVEPLQNALSRLFERQSDRYALESTQKVAAYRTAFQKLARQNKTDPDPHPLEVFLFHSHPPIAERIAMAAKTED